MCASPALAVAPSVLEEPAGAACCGGRLSAAGQPRASAPLWSPTRSGCLSRADNALSVGDCLTVNNVGIA